MAPDQTPSLALVNDVVLMWFGVGSHQKLVLELGHNRLHASLASSIMPGTGVVMQWAASPCCLHPIRWDRPPLRDAALLIALLPRAGVTAGLMAWVTGAQMNKGRGYSCVVQFPEACSITVGTPVRVRLFLSRRAAGLLHHMCLKDGAMATVVRQGF